MRKFNTLDAMMREVEELETLEKGWDSYGGLPPTRAAIDAINSLILDLEDDSPGYYIANGMSPRGLRHSVIWSKDGLIHDPHPEGGGIDKPNDFFFIIPCKQNTDYLKDMRDMLN